MSQVSEVLEGLAVEIQSSNRSLIREFRIEPSENGLVLLGSAYSFYGKQVAFHEAQRRSGSPIAANLVKVL